VYLPGSCSITGSDRSLNWSGAATRTAGTAVATREPDAAIDARTAVGAVVTGPACPLGPTVTADAGVASTRSVIAGSWPSHLAVAAIVVPFVHRDQPSATGCRRVAPNTRSSVSRQCPKTGANRLDRKTQIGQTAPPDLDVLDAIEQ